MKWVGDGFAWFLSGDTRYSLRTEENDAFPFDLFEELMEESLRCVTGGGERDIEGES